MQPRINPHTAAPDLMKAMMQFEETVSHSGLEKALGELVKIRASQINGCACFCCRRVSYVTVGGGLMGEGRKYFFFEKKKQKTFAS